MMAWIDEAAEGEGCSPNAQHVVFLERASQRQFAEVAGNPPVDRVGGFDEAVRPQVHGRAYGARTLGDRLDQAEVERASEAECGQGSRSDIHLNIESENKQRRECVDGRGRTRCPACRKHPTRGHPVSTVESSLGFLTPESSECRHAEIGGGQVGAKKPKKFRSHPAI
jgi:hypothetical protein